LGQQLAGRGIGMGSGLAATAGQGLESDKAYAQMTELMKLRLTDEQINTLIKGDQKFFESSYLRNLETSQLVVILKLYSYLGMRTLDYEKKAIIEEIYLRITSEGIKQYRDGFVSSEATYYVLFCNYMRNTLEKLKDYKNMTLS